MKKVEDHIWNISVDANKEISVHLVFKPIKHVSHDFILSASILGI